MHFNCEIAIHSAPPIEIFRLLLNSNHPTLKTIGTLPLNTSTQLGIKSIEVENFRGANSPNTGSSTESREELLSLTGEIRARSHFETPKEQLDEQEQSDEEFKPENFLTRCTSKFVRFDGHHSIVHALTASAEPPVITSGAGKSAESDPTLLSYLTQPQLHLTHGVLSIDFFEPHFLGAYFGLTPTLVGEIRIIISESSFKLSGRFDSLKKPSAITNAGDGILTAIHQILANLGVHPDLLGEIV